VPEASAADFEAEAEASGASLTMIGRLEKGEGKVRVIGPDGDPLTLARKGFTHF
jgi:hypothetical protein